MMQVKIRKFGAAVVGVSTLATAGVVALGCGVESSEPDRNNQQTPLGTVSSAATREGDDAGAANADAGETPAAQASATLQVDEQYGSDIRVAFSVRDATDDQLIRTGQSLKLSIPSYLIWSEIHKTDGASYPWNEQDRLQQLKGNVQVSFLRKGNLVSTQTVAIETWSQDYSPNAITGTFQVPQGVDMIRCGFTFADDGAPELTAQIASERSLGMPVFGANPAIKNALFSNEGATLKDRIIEGGALVAGGQVMLSMEDWRADALVDASSIDRKIGTQKVYGRGGESIIPIYGEIVHEVTAGVYFDDASGWRAEESMVERYDSAVIANKASWQKRHTYERLLSIPQAASKMSVYFHVKTYLVVDYSRYPNALERTRENGKYLVRERWDNNGGAGRDYKYDLARLDNIEKEPVWPSDVRRTVIVIRTETRPGQDLFMIGGLDHAVAKGLLGTSCVGADGKPTYACAVPIVHNNRKNQYNEAWKVGDNFLDWYGVEKDQTGKVNGVLSFGTPADWTTSYWPEDWGPAKTVEVDGYGLSTFNMLYGTGNWMLDVQMDCSKAYHSPDGRAWVEVKSYVSNGPAYEADVQQARLEYSYGSNTSPYATKNHLARCGAVNAFTNAVPYWNIQALESPAQ